MKLKSILRAMALAVCAIAPTASYAWLGMPMPELRVEGRYLVDTHGNKVNLHGFAQTYSPWFNELGQKWSNYNVNECLRYNKEKIDEILAAGWDVNFVRMHMDPYWSNTPGKPTDGEHDISAFDFNRFKTYLDRVFIPMAEYAISHGLYVVMRPPGVCPENIAVGDAYHQYLIKVWTYVAQQERLVNNPCVMFELANEPINILGTDGQYGNNSRACFEALSNFFQQIVDAMRAEGCRNILWIPGLCWQMHYSGYAQYPIKGDNIGYAVHLYPGWFGSSSSFSEFERGWDADVKPAADIAPIMVTEMDWADEKYNASWGKAHTGEPYGEGSDNFGANFKLIMDKSGNCSWLLFTSPEMLGRFVDVPGTPGHYTFYNDPEACPWPVYHWYKEYREAHDYPFPDFKHDFKSDYGDGTFTNPVIMGDFPDVDLVRVGDTYYMLSTTMFLFPGATIMRSYDLVNWEYCSNPIDYIERNDAYDLANGENRYSRGMWASSLQYHDGKFYLLFNTLNEGGYLMTATDPEGPWTKQHLQNAFYDCGILFDGDDIYVVHGNTEIWIDRVDEDFKVLETHKVYTGPSNNAIEGSRLYHIGDYYYVYCTYSGWPGKQTCLRSKDIFGTYEEKLLFDHAAIHQGALVDTESGQWWTILHRDRWPWGRMPYLLPVEFVDGWPLIAPDADDDEYEDFDKPDIKPIHSTPHIESNDVFRSYNLGKQWQWNHNPDASKWSLVERAGYLRLHTASVTNTLYQARNTLTQRMLGDYKDTNHSYGTIAMDISAMKDGDRAGIATLQDAMACVGVKMEGTKKVLYYRQESLTGKIKVLENDGPTVTGDILYLRAVASFMDPGRIEFYYSTDNQTYNKLGDTFTMQYDLSVFVGNRFAIFNYATKALGGYVDIDWFSTEKTFDENTYYADNFKGYTQESLTVDNLSIPADEIVLMTGSSHTIDVIATYQDGHTENVASSATYTISDPDIVEVSGGKLTGVSDGYATITISYTDPLGHEIELTVRVQSTCFPLVHDLFNPSIYGTGTFDEDTKTVVTGQYGFAGWHYNNGLDLSDYTYLVAKVEKKPTASGLSFRLFDEDNYWAGAAEFDKKTNKAEYDYFVARLQSMNKADGSRKLDPSHIYYIGFWTLGNQPFVIRSIYLTNQTKYLDDDPTGISDAEYDVVLPVNVYTIDGIMLYESITRAEALERLPSGLYIIGDKKVLIQK